MKILKFSASWCGPCKGLKMSMDAAGVELPSDCEVDIDEDVDTAIKYQVRGVPTLLKLDDAGNEIDRKVGAFANQEQLKEWFNVS